MKENNSKEINLLDLILLFFNWLKRLGLGLLNLLGNTLRLLFRQKTISITILAFCFALGYFYFGSSSRHEYRAETMAILNGSSAQTVKGLSRQLESSSTLSDFTTLSSKLSLPDSIAQNITEIASFYVIDYLNDSTPDVIDFKGNYSFEDTVNVIMPNRLYFRIKTRNVSQIPAFEAAFLNYFNSNERLVREFDIKRNVLSEKIQYAANEINRLDSLSKLTYLKPGEDHLRYINNRLIVGEQYKQLFYKEVWNLQKRKETNELEFANFINPVVFPTGFIVNARHETGRIKYTAICCLVGLAVSILLALFIENRKCIFNYLSKKE